MSEDLKKAIQSLGDELQKNAQRQVEIKKTINQLSALMGEPPHIRSWRSNRLQVL